MDALQIVRSSTRRADRATCRAVGASLPLLLVLAGCIGAAPAPDQADPDQSVSWDAFKAEAAKHTFVRPDGTVLYNVEWDLWVTEAELRERYDLAQQPAQQPAQPSHETDEGELIAKAHAFVRISDSHVRAYSFPAHVDISYCVSNDFGSEKATWVARMKSATHAWEEVANIRFRYDSWYDYDCTIDTDEVDFAVTRNDTGSYCGTPKLAWHTTCTAGIGALDIDPDVDPTGGGTFPNLTEVGILRHELGHILGLRHEHLWRPEGTGSGFCNERITMEETDTTAVQVGDVGYDQRSVMHYPGDDSNVFFDCNGYRLSDYSLTAADGLSAQRLYGIPVAWIPPI